MFEQVYTDGLAKKAKEFLEDFSSKHNLSSFIFEEDGSSEFIVGESQKICIYLQDNYTFSLMTKFDIETGLLNNRFRELIGVLSRGSMKPNAPSVSWDDESVFSVQHFDVRVLTLEQFELLLAEYLEWVRTAPKWVKQLRDQGSESVSEFINLLGVKV